MKNKKNLMSYFKHCLLIPGFKYTLNLLIAFQLIIQPYAAAQTPLTANGEKHLAMAERFNRDHVEFLRKLFFGHSSGGNVEGYYENHPLDLFSLLGQQIHRKHKKDFFEKSKEFLTQLKSADGMEENTEFKNKVEQLLKGLNQNDLSQALYYSNHDYPFERKFKPILEELTKEGGNNHIPGFYKKAKKMLKQLESKEFISHKNLLVEIIEDQKDAEVNPLQAVLSHQDKQAQAPQILSEELAERFTGSVFQYPAGLQGKKFLFKLNYHDKKIVYTFPNHIKWMAFFGPYLIFLEPSKISGKKALISFIDLSYFETAIGKTALPIFYLPVHLKKGISVESVVSPQNIKITNDQLFIGDRVVELNQMDYISQLQQLAFNVTVFIADPANAKISQEFLKEIAHHFEQSLLIAIEQDLLSGKKEDLVAINSEMMNPTLKIIEHYQQIGSAQNVSGNHGQLQKAQINLSMERPEDELVKDFKNALSTNKDFQQLLQQIYAETNKNRGVLRRTFVFLHHITRPQPLGAPKITKALGLIANSVLPGETVQGRFLAFKEALLQFLHPGKNRFVTVSVLSGAGLIASPELAKYSYIALDTMGVWLDNWTDLVSVTIDKSFEWASADGLHNAYFEGDKKFNLMTGMASLFAIILTFIGSIHLGANLSDLRKNMTTEEEKLHRREVKGLLNKLKISKRLFINYMEKNRLDYVENLALAEKNKLGILLRMNFGLGGIETRQLFRTASTLNKFYEALDSEKKISLEITAKNEKGQVVILNLDSEPRGTDKPLKNNQILLFVSQKNIKQIFTCSDESLKILLENNEAFNSKLNLSMRLLGEDLHIDGSLQNADFSPEDHERLNKILSDIELETGKILLDSESSMTGQEIKSLNRAMAHLIMSYSSWSKTFRMMGLGWNWFFFVRSIYIHPETLFRLMYYSKYFKVAYEDDHIPTVFNGGKQSRWSRWKTALNSIKKNEKSPNEIRSSIKKFENQIIKIEKQFFEEVTAQAHIKLIEQIGVSSKKVKKVNVGILAKGPNSLDPSDIKNRKLRLFYEIYQRELFHEVMRDYLSESTGVKDGNLNDRNLKNERFAQFLNGEIDFPSDSLDKKEVEARVLRVAQEHDIAQKAQSAIDLLITGFLKRVATARDRISNESLNPRKSKQMSRMDVTKKMLNNHEALARATRQQLANLIIDKPMEIFFTFLILSAVDQGILQILHDKPFTEEAWFYLSRYAIWAGLFFNIVMDSLAGVWLKVQQDSRLEEIQGFDIVPKKEDVEKRFGFIRWLKKQFMAEDNSFVANYKHFWMNLMIPNIPAALFTMSVIWAITLGRFDLDVYLSIYLAALLPFTGWAFKLENGFEKSANWVLKDLIKKELDLNGKDRRFLSHPSVQAIKIKESGKLRTKFNFWYALLYDNPMGNILNIFGNIDTSMGSRGFARLSFGGSLPTEYWVSFMNFLENKNVLSSNVAEICKSVFTNNRTDL